MGRQQAERGIFLVALVDPRFTEEARVGNTLARPCVERCDQRYDVVVRRVLVVLIDADRGDVGAVRRTPRNRGLRQLAIVGRSEEHTYELQSLMRTSYAVFCLKKK